MWTRSVSCWLCLFTLAAVWVFFVSEAHPAMALSCCKNITSTKVRVKQCYEQKSRMHCKHHAFVIKNSNGTWCISPTTKWLQDMIKNGKIRCPPDISPP
ncbi:hypothetical protein EXN66_Car019554 [Channa argus]|uniref:Chemokine interleukin-8-like domain-containing protein n=1 Tax=Channa argus TaxID=215402 RepID=A0A6G1QP59_CHAAH|nr:hypothetical protein EXN66_Car019554 [Channa argus]